MRFAYDCCYFQFMKKAIKLESPLTPSDGFNMHQSMPSPERKSSRKNSYSKYCSKATYLLNKIYQWDTEFRYTTIATSTYTIAFVLLHYLTCMFTFQSLMGTSSISFYILCMEFIFEIGIVLLSICFNRLSDFFCLDVNDWSFGGEIILSGIITMIIFGYQFFKEMINYREHTKQLKDDNCEQIPRLNESEKESIAHKSIGYLTSIILNIIGSFFIWFHIILFLTILSSLLSFRAFTAQIHRLEFLSSIISFVAPLLVLYGLKKTLTQWFRIFISSDQDHGRNHNQNNLPNEKSYSILMYFTFISSKLFQNEESAFKCLSISEQAVILWFFLQYFV